MQFRVKPLADSWQGGRFNDFSGAFTYDTEDTSNSGIGCDLGPPARNVEMILSIEGVRQ